MSVLQNGQYGAMLHYFYKLSEEKFSSDLFAFTQTEARLRSALRDHLFPFLLFAPPYCVLRSFFLGPSIFIISFCVWRYVNQRAFTTKFTVS